MDNDKIKPIAFFLPQYHPIPENDKWWGKGFTEWRNVAKAKPLFPGHYQPHLPADLGFYDLRLPEVRQAQAEMARGHGIHGFCYYHYWFNGKRLLERPLDEILETGEPDFPFCLCWANENWTRRWDGLNKEVLIGQVYSKEDDLNHIRWLAEVFSDPRYIRFEGKPIFLVYRASEFPNPKETTDIWREEALRLGIGELFLCRVESFINEHTDPKELGFDAGVEFQPDWRRLPFPKQRGRRWDLKRKVGIGSKSYASNFVFDYKRIVDVMTKKEDVDHMQFHCVTPSWDNTARRQNGNATIFDGATPELYQKWLDSVILRTVKKPENKGFFFINAWNEWAEGNHLEPCQKWGDAFLKTTKESIQKFSNWEGP